jgi:hypothetical protein
VIPYGCGKGCGVDMVYMGDGNWECPTCGSVIAFGEPDEDDEDNGEALSIWEAADIYLSHGFDEDYRFGYTHDELMKALRKNK